jgi:hypothetical protein
MGDGIGNGSYLTREAIIGATDIETIDVPVPEWGGVIRLRAMTALERENYEMMLGQTRERNGGLLNNVRASLVAWCAIDGDGRKLFKADDISTLGTKSSAALVRVFDAARRLNAMTPDEVDDTKKNSGATSAGGSVLD